MSDDVMNKKDGLLKHSLMTDSHTPTQRHANMAAIRGKNTKPEIIVRKWLWREGFRYRVNDKKLPGKPDIVLPKYRVAIFINGCFWHGHEGCRYYTVPKSNTEFWTSKVARNKERDLKNTTLLREQGWAVWTIWECQLKNNTLLETLLSLSYQLSHRLLQIHSKAYGGMEPEIVIAAEE